MSSKPVARESRRPFRQKAMMNKFFIMLVVSLLLPVATSTGGSQNTFRYSGGIVFRF